HDTLLSVRASTAAHHPRPRSAGGQRQTCEGCTRAHGGRNVRGGQGCDAVLRHEVCSSRKEMSVQEVDAAGERWGIAGMMRAFCRSSGLLLALSAGGAMLVLAATACCGPGLTPDSGCYLSAARSLAAGRGCIPFSGHPFVEWPPLYPA